MRIGIGYDIHRLVEGRKLILGGVEIPYSKGLLGHSDGDAVLHALADALFGSLGLGDIGTYFPGSKENQGIDSKLILQKAFLEVKQKKMVVSNADICIICEEPKLSPHTEGMKKIIASILEVSPDDIGIKARTNEKLGPIGNGEAIAVIVNVLLRKTSELN